LFAPPSGIVVYATDNWRAHAKRAASIHNVTTATVSFDYTIPLNWPYSTLTGTVTALGAGATSQTDLCILGCGDMLGAIKST